MNDLTRLENWLSPLLAKLQPAERRQLARTVATSLRTSNRQNMQAQQSADGQAWVPRKNRSRDAKGRLRQGPMFQKLRLARHLRMRSTTDEAVLQFLGRADRIARVHHYGLRDRVTEGGAQYQYPERSLLGISDGQMDELRDVILERLTSF